MPGPALLSAGVQRIGRAEVGCLALEPAELEVRVEDAGLRDAGLAVLAFLSLLAQLRGGLVARRDRTRAAARDGLAHGRAGEIARVQLAAAALAGRAIARVAAVEPPRVRVALPR